MSLREKVKGTRNACDVPLYPVPTPEWPELDGLLYVRVMSVFEADQLFSRNADEDDGNDRARFVCAVVVDEQHNRVFTDDDAVWLGHKEINVIERIYWAGREHNGLTEENRKLVRKNLSAAAVSGLPSSSAAPSTPDTVST
jgi:hypothetical protein